MNRFLVAIAIVSVLSGCYYDNLEELHPEITPCDTTGTISYASNIAPIMLNSCGASDNGCHNTGSATSGFGLQSHLELTNTIGNTEFLKVIKHDPSINSSKWMPKGSSSKIDDCSIQTIEAWINRGMPNN